MHSPNKPKFPPSFSVISHWTTKKHKSIFEFVNEKYDANPKGLIPFRLPTVDEKALTLPPPGRPETVQRKLTIPPPPIESFDDGLDNLAQIKQDWEGFKTENDDIECERHSDTEFLITFAKPIHFLIVRINLTPLRLKPTSYTLAISTPIPPSTDLHALIIKELSLHKKPESFAQFLNLVKSYKSILSEPCRSCNKLIGNSTSDPPVLRRWTDNTWEAWHKTC